MKLLLVAPVLALIVWSPLAAVAQSDARNTVYVDISTNRGPTKIPLVRKGSGFTGPRGEYYASFPSKKTLEAVYGSGAVPTPTPKSKATPTPKPTGSSTKGDFKVTTFSGGVKVYRGGKFAREIKTKYPDIRGWRIIRDGGAIVIKSGTGREPGYIELFDLVTGAREGKVKATEVKDGKPSWAKHFAE